MWRPREVVPLIPGRSVSLNLFLFFLPSILSAEDHEDTLGTELAHSDRILFYMPPHYRKDTGLLESVQWRMSKRIQGMRNIHYEARLKSLNLHSLKRCRLREDLIEVLNWYRGYNEGDISKVVRINKQDITRNSRFKLEKSGSGE